MIRGRGHAFATLRCAFLAVPLLKLPILVAAVFRESTSNIYSLLKPSKFFDPYSHFIVSTCCMISRVDSV